MKLEFLASRASADEWQRVANIRLRALKDSPEWFSGDFAKESARPENEWRDLISSLHWVIFVNNGRDVGMMTVEKADPIRQTDCWLGGCWVDPELRGRGFTATMIEELDRICALEGWRSQGLGVWPSNKVAIRAYEGVGFVKIGEPQPSRSKPGQLYQMMKRSL